MISLVCAWPQITADVLHVWSSQQRATSQSHTVMTPATLYDDKNVPRYIGACGKTKIGNHAEYCHNPNIKEYLNETRNSKPSHVVPFGLCEGNCNSNNNCDGLLECFILVFIFGL